MDEVGENVSSPELLRLVYARKLIDRMAMRFELNQFDHKRWTEPPDEQTLQIKESYFVILNCISENLHIKKDCTLRADYPSLFEEAKGLHDLCIVLDHRYEVMTHVQFVIDWNKIWRVITILVPNSLRPKLQYAIEQEWGDLPEGY